MKIRFALLCTLSLAISASTQAGHHKEGEKKETATNKSVRILHIGGGCCHDYPNQDKILNTAMEKVIKCSIDSYIQGKKRDVKNTVFDKDNWADGYDLVLFNICYGGITDDDYINNIIKQATNKKRGVAFVHCSLHTFRNAPKAAKNWRDFIGVSSKKHGKKSPIEVKRVKEHPILDGLPETWKTPNGELYNIFGKAETVTVLAEGNYPGSKDKHPVIWVNEYNGCRIFGTSMGHHNVTMQAEEYQKFFGRGVLWAMEKLDK